LLRFPGSFRPYFASIENSDETDELEFRCQIFIAASAAFIASPFYGNLRALAYEIPLSPANAKFD